MGGNISTRKNKTRIYLSKGMAPKALRKLFKKKKKYVVIEDEVDSAVPYVQGQKKSRNDLDTRTQRSISVEATASGRIEVCVDGACGYNNIPSDTSEWEEESMSSFDILDTETDMPKTPSSIQRNLSDRGTVYTPDSALDVHYTTDTSVDDCHLCKANNTEYMVQVFMPTLQRHLDVKEVLPYLHYISHNDARTLSSTEPQELAVKTLIDTIILTVDQQGKWTTFLVALDKTGHIYLHQLLTGMTEKDHFFTNEILKLMKPSLINDIHLSDVIDLLIDRSIINDEDQSQIESAEKSRGSIHAVRVMLEKVDKRIPNWDTEFAEVLNKSGMSEIAEVFKMVEHHEHFEPKDDKNLKQKHKRGKSFKRKLKPAKRGNCWMHNRGKTTHANGASLEPESKRQKPNMSSTIENGGMTNKAFVMPSNGHTTHVEEEGLTNDMTGMKEVSATVETIMDNQTKMMSKIDELMQVLNGHMIRSVEEHRLLKQQISEQNQALQCLNQTVSKISID